ncbi:hypothetical protein ACJQWK_05246 [Exserohilum turcicum]
MHLRRPPVCKGPSGLHIPVFVEPGLTIDFQEIKQVLGAVFRPQCLPACLLGRLWVPLPAASECAYAQPYLVPGRRRLMHDGDVLGLGPTGLPIAQCPDGFEFAGCAYVARVGTS